MRRSVYFAVAAWVAVLSVVVASQTATPQPASPRPSPATEYRAVLDKYCVTCHNERLKTADLTLDTFDLTNLSAHAEVGEKVIRKLRARMMPPAGMPRPDSATYDGLATWLETSLDRASAARRDPGPPLLHRLNRTEYANAVRDLLDLEVDVAPLLPPDDSLWGFDNIAGALGVTPILLERYLSAAGKIAALAVGDPDTAATSWFYRIRQDLSQDKHIDGMPYGTVGGIKVRPTLPLDGEFIIQPKLIRTNLGVMRGLEHVSRLEIAVDGQRVHLAEFGGLDVFKEELSNQTKVGDEVDAKLRVRVALTAGPHDVTIAFVPKSEGLTTLRLQPYVRSSYDTVDITGLPHLETVLISGPFNPTGPGDTPSRRRVFSCTPASAQGSGGARPANAAGEPACARTIVSTLARRAFRRPVTVGEMDRLMAFYDQGRSGGTFERGIQLALQRILASPFFAFRAERPPDNVAAGAAYRISDLELASKLSFFLWSSIPDDQLVNLAVQGRLRNPAVLAQQVKRMMDDPRAALVQNFAGQWLFLRNLPAHVPDNLAYPDFDDNLRTAFRRETEMLFDAIIREDRSVLELLTADFTFVNERSAQHYGIPGIYGSHMRRVRVTDPNRQGILGHGSILTVTSHVDRTSPVVRGKWILENLMGATPPPPPANVVIPPLAANEAGARPRTLRERMETHRQNPACASCHRVMDPIGFSLENFDGVGVWRAKEDGNPIDAAGQLVDGTPVSGPVQLRNAILSRPENFVQTMTEKMLIYALGRGLEPQDMRTVRAIVRDAARTNFKFSSILMGIVNSEPFQMRLKPAPAGATAIALNR